MPSVTLAGSRGKDSYEFVCLYGTGGDLVIGDNDGNRLFTHYTEIDALLSKVRSARSTLTFQDDTVYLDTNSVERLENVLEAAERVDGRYTFA